MFPHKIRVSGKGIKEFVSHTKNIEKLYLAYHLKDILEKGKEQEKQELKHDRKDGIKYFIPIKTQTKIDKKLKIVRSFIAVDKNGNMFYDLFIDKTTVELSNPKKESGSNSTVDNNNIQQTNNSVNQDILNLFIEDETESKNNNSKLPLTYYDYFHLVYLKSHDYKEFLRQVDLYEVKVKNQDFKESDHPRDEDGRFSEKSKVDDKVEQKKIDTNKKSKITHSLLGENFEGYKGQNAISKLLIEKRGHIKDAFYRDEIGSISLLWGDDTLGLQHIIKEREKQGINIDDFLSDITDVIEKGNFLKINTKGRHEFKLGNKVVIIETREINKNITFLLTAYKQS